MTSTRGPIFLIWESALPICWAITPFEARKEIANRARNCLAKLDPKYEDCNIPTPIKWKGQEPAEEGYCLIYSLPDPPIPTELGKAGSTNTISICNAKKVFRKTGFFSYDEGKLEWEESSYNVCIKTLGRATSVVGTEEKRQMKSLNVIQGKVPNRQKPVRGESLHDQMLNMR